MWVLILFNVFFFKYKFNSSKFMCIWHLEFGIFYIYEFIFYFHFTFSFSNCNFFIIELLAHISKTLPLYFFKSLQTNPIIAHKI